MAKYRQEITRAQTPTTISTTNGSNGNGPRYTIIRKGA